MVPGQRAPVLPQRIPVHRNLVPQGDRFLACSVAKHDDERERSVKRIVRGSGLPCLDSVG